MATTTVHAQLIRYTTNGDQVVVNLKSTGSDVSIDRSTNTKLPTSVTSAQALADALGSLAFKNSLGKGDVGLGNVDNTADSAKSVKYATSAGSANAVAWGNVSGKPSTFAPSSHTHNYAGSSSAGGAANSANKLTTARAINGVNFDGTAGITITANPTSTNTNNEDLNSVTTPGFYYGGGSNTSKNKPDGVDAFGMIVFKTASGYTTQVLVEGNSSDGKMWIRQYNSSEWSGWNYMYTTAYKPSKSDVGLGNVDNTADSAKSVRYATSAGSAGSATKATQDSAGQAINSTYIKSLSASGRTITITKGDNTTTTITTQDTNTTYNVFAKATASAAGGTGLVPAPAKGQQGLYLRGDGTWATPTNTVYTHPNSGVTAGTYRSVTVNAQGHVTSGSNPTTLGGYGITDAAAKSHKHVAADITDNIPASKISGTLSLSNIPAGALERLIPVADDTARFRLTSSNAQNGDVVKVTSTGKMYFIKDDTKLSTEDGYEVFAAGTAAAVAWTNVTGRPSSMPASDVYAWAKAASKPIYSKSEVGLSNVDNTADSAKSVKYAASAGSANAVAWANVTGKPSTFAPSSHTHSYAGSGSAGGNANAAVKLATARKIGNASFDGTADITLSQIGVSIATSSNLGIIKPDGKTTFVDENGVLSAKTGTTLAPKPVSNLAIKNGDQSVTITWEDPIDTVVDGTTISTWAGTKLVMNSSRYPTDPSDGIVIVDNTTRNKYKSTGFTYSGLTNGVKYYFALFPYNTNDIYNYDNGNRILGEPQESSKIATFADGTDEEIINMIQRHYAGEINISDYWSVGDTRKVYLSAMAATNVGESYSESHRAQYVEFVIGDFDHDDLVASINGHGTAAVTLLQKDCLMDADNEANPVNGQNNTENGYINSSSSNYGGWDNCERRKWCNEVYLNALPSTIKDAVKTVYKGTTSGSKSSNITLSTDKVFLASEYEILGRIDCAAAKEGYQYQYYTLATANRYKNPKYNQNQFSAKYWTRSPYKDNVYNFCDIGIIGNGGANLAYVPSGIAPCICL